MGRNLYLMVSSRESRSRFARALHLIPAHPQPPKRILRTTQYSPRGNRHPRLTVFVLPVYHLLYHVSLHTSLSVTAIAN